MPKQKPSARIQVADGAGGMRRVLDLRFEAGEWPIKLVVSAKDAATWMAHLRAEMQERDGAPVNFLSLMVPRTAERLLYILRVVRHLRV